MNKFYKIFILFLIVRVSLVGQDMHFTQFYSSPLYLNPAFAGADVCSRVSLTYRNQWPGIYKTYKSYLLGMDHNFQSSNIGVGLLVGDDVAGSGSLRTTIIDPMIAYQARLNKKLYLRGAVQPGIEMRSINFNQLTFGDQIGRGGNVASVETPTQTRTFFDAGAGILLYTEKYWGGVSMYHINKPNESFYGEESARLPVKYSVHGGAKFLINKDEKDEALMKYVSGVFNYRGQNKFDQLDVGVYYAQNFVTFGLWYRGLPTKHYKPGYANNDAVAIIIGLKTKKLNIGYSFDITISKLAGLSKGAHEVTLSYRICTKAKKKKKLVVPCPKF
ncbi:MAG: PorP/SprF family type IX secretion system membrane protein [Bacteroidia bacterium]